MLADRAIVKAKTASDGDRSGYALLKFQVQANQRCVQH
jgi:hypothetical protein